MTAVKPSLVVVKITSLRDSESQERVALYLSGWLRDKTVEELRGFLNRLPIIITRQATPELADRLQRELSALGAAYFGYRHAHQMNQTQAIIAMFLPLALFLALIFFIVIALIAWFLGSSGGLQKLLHD